jgi:hypothetical protein
LVVADGTAMQTYPLAGVVGSDDRRHPTAAQIVIDGTGAFIVVANIGGELEVFDVVKSAAPVDTGLALSLVAAGSDATGLYAWVATTDAQTEPVLERVRPPASGTTWTVDRGPISGYAIAGRTGTDGTLVVAYGVDAGSFFDNMQKVAVARLPPAATAFDAEQYPDNISWDDYIASAQLAIAADGARAVLGYSTQQYDEQSDHAAPYAVRTLAGMWTDASSLSPTIPDGNYAFTATSFATIDADDHGLTIVADMTKPTETTAIPLWPAQPAGLYIDGAGVARPLIEADGKLYFPTPPAP